jgi:putative MATE family efflux protein
MIATILGTVINIILDPILIFGWGPFPEMGVAGAAWATVIANMISAGLVVYYFIARRSVYRLRPHHLKPNIVIIIDIYRVGLPSTLMEVTESFLFLLFNRVVADFGSVALAAGGIAIRVADLVFMPIFGTSQGLLPIVGFSFGAHLWHRLWGAVRLASLGLAIILAAFTLVLEILAPQIISLFNADPSLLEYAVPAMRIIMSTIAFIGPAVMFITTFQGLGRGNTAMVLSLARQLIFFVPALYILVRVVGLNGAWLSIPVSDSCGLLISGIWLYREYRRQKKSWSEDKVPLGTAD